MPLALLLVVGALTGCATGRLTLVEPKRAVVGGGALTLTPGIPWTSTTNGTEEWTVDGFRLHALRFYPATADGQPIVGSGRSEPRFRLGMAEAEIVDLVRESLFAGRPDATESVSMRFGTVPGFRFEVPHMLYGVNRRALVATAVVRDRLHLIVYDAAAIHYYERYLPEVERLLESLRFE